MKNFTYILIFNCLLFVVNCYAQPITWNKLYDGGFNDKDYGEGICQTTDGNFVIGGATRFHHYTVALKIDGFGNIIWLKHYSATYGEALTSTNDGGCLIVSPSFLKINSLGDSMWYHNYSSYGVTNLYDVIQCSDSGYFTCGRSYYDSGYVMKTDISGNFLWKQIISDSILFVRLYTVCEAYSNGYLVAGLKAGLNAYKSVIGRFGFNGERIWVRVFDSGDSLGSGIRIIRLPPNYLIGCGKGFLKIDDQGNVLSSKLIPMDFNDEIVDVQMINSNKFTIVTTNDQYPVTSSKLRIVDSSGNTIFSKGLGFSDYVRLKKIHLAGNGDVIFAGEASRYDTSYSDFYVVRTDSILNCPPIGLKIISQNAPNEFILHQNFPNPFNPVTNIIYELPKASFVNLTLYDITGKEIENLVNSDQSAGKNEVTWDGTNYASGIYFYKLTTTEYNETKKMVLLK